MGLLNVEPLDLSECIHMGVISIQTPRFYSNIHLMLLGLPTAAAISLV